MLLLLTVQKTLLQHPLQHQLQLQPLLQHPLQQHLKHQLQLSSQEAIAMLKEEQDHK